MDRAIVSQMVTFARNFLSTSQAFEPYVPNSQQNALYALTLLGNLGELTRASLEEISIKTAPAPEKPIAPPKPPTKVKDAAILEALNELRNSNRLLKRGSGMYASILRVNHP